MDSEDGEFLEEELKKKRAFEVDALLFEDMIDKLEKNSGNCHVLSKNLFWDKFDFIRCEDLFNSKNLSIGHNVVTVKEAKHLLPGGDELIIAVYDYWVDKRLKLRHPLVRKYLLSNYSSTLRSQIHFLNSDSCSKVW